MASMFSSLKRTLRHRWLEASDARRAIGTEGMARLQAKVAASEQSHTGEIRICVEGGLPLSYLRRDADARERAVMLFGKLRVWDTHHNNGVLIYLLLADHRIEIVADRGLAAVESEATWALLTQRMSEQFRAGRFADGLEEAVAAVHARLVVHFPAEPGSHNPNELPDAVVLL